MQIGSSDIKRREEFARLSKSQQDLLVRILDLDHALAKISNAIIVSGKDVKAHLSAHITKQHDAQLDVLQKEALKARRARLLTALQFPEMKFRRNMIESRMGSQGGTYEWLFQPTEATSPDQGVHDSFVDASESAELRSSRSAVADWLKGSETVFWISGKPGSGKSSLMSCIYSGLHSDGAGSQLLQQWAGNTSVQVLDFWFFRPASTALLKTVEGLWRSLCFQVLDADPALCERIRIDTTPSMPVQLRASLSLDGSHVETWTENELQSWFHYLLEQSEKWFVLHLDGLDEVEVGRAALLEAVLSISTYHPRVKMICASRAENPFAARLQQFPSLYLHDLNYSDIRKDCEARLAGSSASLLTMQIACGADGVFLWARTVADDLARAAANGADFEELTKRFKECPTKMGDLFELMLSRQDNFDRKSPKPFLRLVDVYQQALAEPGSFIHCEHLPITMLELFLATLATREQPRWAELNKAFDNAYLNFLAENFHPFEKRVITASAGLLQTVYHRSPFYDYDEYPASHVMSGVKREMKKDGSMGSLWEASSVDVVFMHRSVQDFLRESDAGRRYAERVAISTEEAKRMLLSGVAASFFISDRVSLDRQRLFKVPLLLRSLMAGQHADTPGLITPVYWRRLAWLALNSDTMANLIPVEEKCPVIGLQQNLTMRYLTLSQNIDGVLTEIAAAEPSRTGLLAGLSYFIVASHFRAHQGDHGKMDYVERLRSWRLALGQYLQDDTLITLQHRYRQVEPWHNEETPSAMLQPVYSLSTRPVIEHAMAAFLEVFCNVGVASFFGPINIFRRRIDKVSNVPSSSEVEKSARSVELWLTVDRETSRCTVIPVPESEYVSAMQTLLIFVLQVRPFVSPEEITWPYPIVGWKASQSTTFIDVPAALQCKFRIGHHGQGFHALMEEFDQYFIDQIQVLASNMTDRSDQKSFLESNLIHKLPGTILIVDSAKSNYSDWRPRRILRAWGHLPWHNDLKTK